jgi:hypothetical protein
MVRKSTVVPAMASSVAVAADSETWYVGAHFLAKQPGTNHLAQEK